MIESQKYQLTDGFIQQVENSTHVHIASVIGSERVYFFALREIKRVSA